MERQAVAADEELTRKKTRACTNSTHSTHRHTLNSCYFTACVSNNSFV